MKKNEMFIMKNFSGSMCVCVFVKRTGERYNNSKEEVREKTHTRFFLGLENG